ncbi:4-hydroxybenzoate 3-monooxygenase [Arenicella xantha]|uniref:4-hydroxybenzoate 3-monooxygenase n=1 Tax=Arenicella xantha TaxID=644221 RepID=A0A395JFP8_9GAMM|nr:4-hydroxybenzoate 3-monooxygenase [Arenicella xantha]RBP47166.1 p-hydroxybenzoate 3-monooxygenase [Arenicella xantha]
MRTQVGIIGGGPSGLLLSQLLHLQGIESVVLERKTQEYVLSRIRAGVLEAGTCDLLRKAKVGQNLDMVGDVHSGIDIVFNGEACNINFTRLTGGDTVTVYGQTEVTRDLYKAREAMNGVIEYSVDDVAIHDLHTTSPHISYKVDGQDKQLECDFVVGCDGYHGVSRQTIPHHQREEYESVYPFGWLGILSETPPVSDELIYAYHERGFALCSMRSPTLSRYYVQVDAGDKVEDWSDERFWDELKRRIPKQAADRLVTGPSIEKSIAPLRSFVCEPMRWQNLFLVGDAAHIVPPTGAKGLNLAASDVHYLYEAMLAYYQKGDKQGLENYSDQALSRVWKSERFAWSLTKLLHYFPEDGVFTNKMRQAEFDYLKSSQAAQSSFAESYVGLPY